jgi:hypothetical protein
MLPKGRAVEVGIDIVPPMEEAGGAATDGSIPGIGVLVGVTADSIAPIGAMVGVTVESWPLTEAALRSPIKSIRAVVFFTKVLRVMNTIMGH